MQQPKILVAIRKRPLSKKEASKNETDIVTVKNCDTVIVSEYKQKVDLTKFLQDSIFNFDFAFNEQTQNEQIYDQAVRPLVDSAFQGAKVTCFAYGQTGSGKTYTMNGHMGQGIPGLYTLGANDIFYYLSSPQFRHLKAKLSFYQIYCGKLFDLLNKRTELKLREDNKNNINIIGLEEASVTSSEEFIEYLTLGSHQRVTSQNSANADSSRSHAILQISLKDGKKLHGKISFIDLAGNQRGADHMDMDKQTRIDGAQINKSLLSLKECIRALDQGKGHTPFRGSKLTMVLKDSFVGFCRTIMIGNVSPSSASSQNTLNTLRYADRVKQLRKPHENGSKQEMKAKQLMLPRQNKNAIRIMIDNQDDAEDIARKRDEAQREYGISEQIPVKKNIPQKQEYNVRKNSALGKNTNQAGNKLDQKSNSLTKNLVANNFRQPQTNNFVASNPNALNSKQMAPTLNSGRQKNEGYQVKYEQNIQNRYGRQKEEPMELQSPSQTPYYVPNNKNTPINNPRYNNNQSRQFQQPNSNGFNSLSQNVSTNYSSIGLNQPSQIINRTMVNQNPYNSSHNSRQINQGMNNYPNNNNNFYNNNSSYQNNFQNNNSMNFMQGRGQIQQQQQQQPQFLMPSNWQQMVSSINTYEDPSVNQQIVSQMNRRLFNQQNELISNHSETLRREIDMIKTQMSVLNEMEMDRSKITSRGYVQFMQESIEDKISILQMLREKMINFTYKLDQMEQIEQLGIGKRCNIDDEQLLDDIN